MLNRFFAPRLGPTGPQLEGGASGPLVGDTDGPLAATTTRRVTPVAGGAGIPLGDLTSAVSELRALVRSPGGGPIDTVSMAALAAALGVTGRAQPLTVDADTVALWSGAGVLSDSGPDGLDLAVDSGAVQYADLLPGLRGFWLDGQTVLARPANDPQLTLTGAMTVQFIALFATTGLLDGDVYSPIGMFNVPPTTPPRDWPWAVNVAQSFGVSFDWIGSSGGSTGDTLSPTPTLVTASRQADGSSQVYLNERLIGGQPAGPLPDDGSDTILNVGGGNPFAEDWTGGLASLRVKNVAVSAGDVLNDYNTTLGPVYGLA